MCIEKVLTILNIFEKIPRVLSWVKNRHFSLNSSHYFKKYHKHVTIYKNGTGIIINSFDIVFNKHTKEELKRAINISDGKKTASFPTIKKMKSETIDKRFDKYGLWVYSDDKIVSSIKEKYWSDSDDESEDIILKKDNKELRWIICFNHSRIKLNKIYHIVYVLSIPEMFPIIDGKIDYESINDLNMLNDDDCGSNSSMEVLNRIDKFKYTVSFENGIMLDRNPECIMTELNQNRKIHMSLNYAYNIIYSKYTCNIRHPKIGSKIKINWKFKGGD